MTPRCVARGRRVTQQQHDVFRYRRRQHLIAWRTSGCADRYLWRRRARGRRQRAIRATVCGILLYRAEGMGMRSYRLYLSNIAYLFATAKKNHCAAETATTAWAFTAVPYRLPDAPPRCYLPPPPLHTDNSAAATPLHIRLTAPRLWAPRILAIAYTNTSRLEQRCDRRGWVAKENYTTASHLPAATTCLSARHPASSSTTDAATQQLRRPLSGRYHLHYISIGE